MNGKTVKVKPRSLLWADRFDSIIVSPLQDHRLWILSKKDEKFVRVKEAKPVKLKGI